MKLHTRIALALALTSLAISSPACAEHRIGGKSISDVFKDPGLAEITDAGCRGDTKTVARLAAIGVDPNGPGLDSVPPIFWAIHCENLAGMEALLKAGANPNYFIPGKFSITYQAATYRNPRILQLILKYGGDPNAGDDWNEWAIKAVIFDAYDTDDWGKYYTILDSNFEINKADSLGSTVAIILASGDRWDKVEELLDRGYNYNLQDLAGYLEFLGPGGRKVKDAKERVAKRLEAMGYKVPDWLGRKK